MNRHFDPLLVAVTAQEAALPREILSLIVALANPLASEIDPVRLEESIDTLYKRVRWAGHCADVYLSFCDRLELQLYFPNGDPQTFH